MKPEELAKKIDHTLLKADASRRDLRKLCDEALKYGFHAVCVNPFRVPFCIGRLKGSGVKICSVVGFPLGATTPELKVGEARAVAELGVDEIDYVVNIGAVKDGDLELVKEEMFGLLDAARPYKILIKAIVEVPLLTLQELRSVCKVLDGVDFLKTSTGFHRPVTVEDVKLLRRFAPSGVKVKAAGGIRSHAQAVDLIKAGADRLGSSRSVDLLRPRRPRMI